MRKYIYNTLAVLMLTLCSVSIKAQELKASITWAESINCKPVYANDIWHIVQGTQATVTLETTVPDNTNEKRYEPGVIYKKGANTLTSNTDTFTPSTGNVSYTATIKYKNYTYDEETASWVTDGIIHEETTPAKTYAIKTYDKPAVTEMAVTADLAYTYIQGSNRTVTANYKITPSGLTSKIEWEVNGNKTEKNGNKYTFVPTEAGDANVLATVTILAPDGTTVWGNSSKSTSIKVYDTPQIKNFTITPDLTYTFVGGSERTISANFSTTPSGLVSKIEWTIDGIKTEGKDNTCKFKPTKAGNSIVQAQLSILAPDGTTIWESKTESTTIKVYDKPEIKGLTVTPDLAYTYVSGSNRTITAQYTTTPSELTSKIEWTIDGVKTVGNDNTCTLRPTKAGNSIVQAKISILAPDGTTIWESKTESTTIKVYKKPEITDFTLTSDLDYTFVGGKKRTIKANYKISPEDLPTKIEWTVNGNLVENDKDTYMFGATATGDASIRAKVTIFAPDGISQWKTMEKQITIHVLTNPQYSENDMHERPSTSHEYAIYVGETFDVSKLYTVAGGHPNGWETKIAVNGDESYSGLKIKPSQKGDYAIKLSVRNTVPGTQEAWLTKIIDYTLHVYDRPTWSTNFDKIFDQGSTTLHVNTGDKVVFEVKPEGGDASKWSIGMIANDEEETPFKKDVEKWGWSYTFSSINDTTEAKTNNLKIHISNTPDYLTQGSKAFDEETTCQIIVWKDIAASIIEPNTIVEGRYSMETRQGDEQQFAVSVFGGDPQKWELATDAGTIKGNLSRQDNMYTYSIRKGELKSNGMEPYHYTFDVKAIYNDGQTHIEKNFPVGILVWPEPNVSHVLAIGNKTGVSFKHNETGENSQTYQNVTCYEGDELELSTLLSGGAANGVWKYQIGNGTKNSMPTTNTISTNGDEIISFYNYMVEGENLVAEKKVLNIDIKAKRYTLPRFTTDKLPTVDKTTSSDWGKAEIKEGTTPIPVDLYGNGIQTATFDFSPQQQHEGNEAGWTYTWKVNEESVATNTSKWSYIAKTTSTAAYEDKIISVDICNAIYSNDIQTGNNIGLSTTKKYLVRVWHKAQLPNSIMFNDTQNHGNDMTETHSIRKGNVMQGYVTPIQYGYAPLGTANYQYVWSGEGASQDYSSSNWETTAKNSRNNDTFGYETKTYGLTVRNVGPRGTYWEDEQLDDCEIIVYNKPQAPLSLVKKGNGTSGTMIVTTNTSDVNLEKSDYYLIFGYTNADGETKFEAQKQVNDGQVRWTSQYKNATEMSSAFVYAAWMDKASKVIITSGRCYLNGTDVEWDDSDYNYASNANKTRSIIGGETTPVEEIASDSGSEDMQVFDTNGILVSKSTKGLPSGVYIIRYIQNGVTRSKKVSIK